MRNSALSYSTMGFMKQQAIQGKLRFLRFSVQTSWG